MIAMQTQRNTESILLAVTASEGQPGSLQLVVDSRCLLRREGSEGYDGGSQMKGSWGPSRLLAKWLGCPSCFDALHACADLLENFGFQKAFSVQLLERKWVQWTAKEEAMSPLGPASVITRGLLGSHYYFSPPSPSHTDLASWVSLILGMEQGAVCLPSL